MTSVMLYQLCFSKRGPGEAFHYSRGFVAQSGKRLFKFKNLRWFHLNNTPHLLSECLHNEIARRETWSTASFVCVRSERRRKNKGFWNATANTLRITMRKEALRARRFAGEERSAGDFFSHLFSKVLSLTVVKQQLPFEFLNKLKAFFFGTISRSPWNPLQQEISAFLLKLWVILLNPAQIKGKQQS